MQKIAAIFAIAALITGLSGCSYVFYPRADEFAQKAKGTTNLETVLNLTTMMEASAEAAKGGTGSDQPLDDLHNQFHAFDNSLCCVDEAKRETPAYALAVTHNKELWAIFKRLWKFKDTQPHRDEHLALFKTEVQELRATLETLK
ncbi:hypothetical protein [Candidatus Nitrospira allomarina]|jgi:hypothetical protein|uniref:Lipoprotein n=1 Tax=Candidatus Nitrospira allomarina TaxID=3020900 RepID=A0AA96JSU9_9BACT|nr:hypothetical protein [Candidatus Nitrospira allomarina]WNM58932.1 hypothetical protein PP769_03965 [Candidatus Nitrospira allomarina]